MCAMEKWCVFIITGEMQLVIRGRRNLTARRRSAVENDEKVPSHLDAMAPHFYIRL